ncbi:YEATS domain-containing protein 2-like [Pomacea canaliculata]|uniref:YEATS domain-containing protein 2-like n=1 Tax=Pomacea canaliculata TaxID=400727 RepID=UPI000D73956C|nr:YEATS domain-containing protein 2-like [Pomacea canaliculata]
MTGKRSCVDLDPDYEDISEHQAKRQRVLEQDAKEASLKKIESIIWSQFKMETENIESDVVIIDQLLNQARSMMDRLRAVTVASYYSRLQQNPGKTSQTSIFPVNAIHPSVKKYLGKAPVATHVKTETVTSPHKDDKNRLNSASAPGHVPQQASTNLGQSQSETPAFSSESADVNRGSRFTEKKTIVVGNVSKHITDRQREVNDHSTHKWMVYVRGPRDNPSIHSFVSKVWFFLHPSYRPNDRVEISSPPFHLTRRGWGEFPVRVQLHFWDERNKRVDIIHNLKLDRSYTGLQTLGAETVVEIELLREFTGNGYSKLHHSLFSDSCLEETVIKEEKEDDGVEVQTGNTETCADVDASNMRLKDECLLDWVSKEVESDSTSYPCEITSATHKTTEVTIKQEPSELITGSHSNISYKTNDSTKGEHIMINRFKKPEPLPVLGSEKGTVTGRASGDTEAIPAKRNDGIEENDFVGDDASACVTSSNSAPFASQSLQTNPCLTSVKVNLGETTPNTVASSPLIMQTTVLSKSSLQSPETSQPSVILVSTAPRAPVVPPVNSSARMVSLLQRPQSVVVPRNVHGSPRMAVPVSAISGSTLNQLHAKSSLSDVNAPKVLMQVTPAGLKVINTQKPLAASAACNSLLTPKEIVVSRSTHTSKISHSLLPPQQKVVGRPSTTAISTNSLLPSQQVVVGRPTTSAATTNSFLPPQQIVIVRPPGSPLVSNCLSLPQQTILTKPVTHIPSRTESIVSGTTVNKVSLLTSPITVATSVQPSKLPAVAARTVSLLKLNGPIQNHNKLSGSSPAGSGVVTSSLTALTPVVTSSNSSKVTLVLPKSNERPVLLNFDLSQIRGQGLMLDPVSIDKPSSLGASSSQNQSAQGQNTKPMARLHT